ncbi:glycine cleavage system protein GcvH [Zhaonella formicivorans]|jgi:glycine cleavage system H protein|uniref:glycine cleavage system protein GcvH n=1 Tax=Zhaonella formicivorans TaxID=2528593 RepID=UPI0010F1EA92|nr:glycine cleavage system protein GcvH [Zhaonella formicivorans]
MIKSDLKYTKDHEWVKVEGNKARIGISHHAQEAMGDVVFVELPEVGDEISQHDSFGTVESVKAVSDVYAPVSGKVVEINEALLDSPELINSDPYGEGWMIVIEVEDEGQLESLLSAEEYEAFLKEAE